MNKLRVDRTKLSRYPEHEKMKAVASHSQEIGNFIEWLREQGMTICAFDERHQEYMPWMSSIEQTLADYFGVDLKKIEQEKNEMLEELRKAKKGR